MNWELDWWNSNIQKYFLNEDMRLAESKFKEDDNDYKTLQAYIKIKNLQLGYTFPESSAKKIFSKLRIYVQVRNAFTFTKYSGFDPEISGGILDTGIDRGAYPQARTYSFGLDIKL